MSSKSTNGARKPKKRAYRPRRKELVQQRPHTHTNINCSELHFTETGPDTDSDHHANRSLILSPNMMTNELSRYTETTTPTVTLKPHCTHSHSRTLSYIKPPPTDCSTCTSITPSMREFSVPRLASPRSPVELQSAYTSPLPSPAPSVSPNMSNKRSTTNLLSFSSVAGSHISASLPSSPCKANHHTLNHPANNHTRDTRHNFLSVGAEHEMINTMGRARSAGNICTVQSDTDTQQTNINGMNPDNIRVMVRFRPFNKTEKKYTERYLNSPFKSPAARSLSAFSHNIEYSQQYTRLKMNYFCGSKKAKQLGANHRSYCFKFDRIFPENSSQKEIFENVAKPICEELLQFKSSNATILCYGQSGSGKTYSMFGAQSQDKNVKKGAKHRRSTSATMDDIAPKSSAEPRNDVETMGIIASSCCYLFDELKDLQQSLYNVYTEFTYNLYVECIEVYNEKLKDLLNCKQQPVIREIEIKRNNKTRSKATLKKKAPKLFKIEVQNVTRKQVKSMQEMLNILQIASLNRTISKTSLNQNSSRSHMVVRLILKTTNSDTQINTESVLSFVDLAGSENVRKSTSVSKNPKNVGKMSPKTRKRQEKEAGNILKSLTALSQVIDALMKNKKHVPYKDSKLTRLLQNSLGGNCTTALLICASPHIYNRYETIRSLKFGLRCQQIRNHSQAAHKKLNTSPDARVSISMSSKLPLVLNNSTTLTEVDADRSITLHLHDAESIPLTIMNGPTKSENRTETTVKHVDEDEDVIIDVVHKDDEDGSTQKLRVSNTGSMRSRSSGYIDFAKLDLATSNAAQTNSEEFQITELRKQIETLTVENEILQSRDELGQHIENLNETISKIVLQSAFKKNRSKKKHRKSKEVDVNQQVENELNIFQSKLIQLTIGINAKLEKLQDLMDDALALSRKNGANLLVAQSSSVAPSVDEEENANHDEGDVSDIETEQVAVNDLLVLEDANSGIGSMPSMPSDDQDTHNKYGTVIKHRPNTDHLLNCINGSKQKIYTEPIVSELRRKNEALIYEVNRLKLEQKNSLKLAATNTDLSTMVFTPDSAAENMADYGDIPDVDNVPTPQQEPGQQTQEPPHTAVNAQNEQQEQEEDDDYYICDDNEVYQNIYNGPLMNARLSINCNVKKPENKPKAVANGKVASSHDSTPRNSGSRGSKIPLLLLKENQTLTLSEQLSRMQKQRQLDRDPENSSDLLQSPMNPNAKNVKFDRCTVSPRDSITLLNTHLIQQLKTNRKSSSCSSSSSSVYYTNAMNASSMTQQNSSFYRTSASSSARSSVNSMTIESIDENLEKWNHHGRQTNQRRISGVKRRSSGIRPVLSATNSMTRSRSDTQHTAVPNEPHNGLITPKDESELMSICETPSKLTQSTTQHVLTFDDLPFAMDECKKQQGVQVRENANEEKDEDDGNAKTNSNKISTILDDPILKEENEDDVEEDAETVVEDEDEETSQYYTDDDTYYTNNFLGNDADPESSMLSGNRMIRQRTDSQIFRDTGLELSRKLKAQSVESPCQTNQRLSSTFAIHWINLKKP